MGLAEDYKTIAEQMSNNFSKKTFFLIRDLMIQEILVDIHFTYVKIEQLNLNLEKIKVEFFNDNIMNEVGDTVSLLHFEISQPIDKFPLQTFCQLSLENLLDYIKDIKFDVLIGRFVPKNNINHHHLRTASLQFATRNLFKSIGIEVMDNSGECSICYERTFCKTVCNHHICFSCCSQLKLSSPNNSDDDDENSEDENIHCPLCRSIVLYSQTGGCCHR